MYQTDKCVVAQVLKVVVIINLIIIDHSRMIQAFRFIEISKYDDDGQLMTRGQLMQGSSSEHPPYISLLEVKDKCLYLSAKWAFTGISGLR